jgi:hypothetical protein
MFHKQTKNPGSRGCPAQLVRLNGWLPEKPAHKRVRPEQALDLLSSGLYRRPRNYTGSCLGR